MTSLLISGYFALCNGRRVSSENPTTRKNTHHVIYDTVIQTAGVDVAAELRTWSPASDPLLADGTVADILGKVYAPPNGVAWIDIIQMSVFPGDVNAEEYEEKVPEKPFPTVMVLGHTSGNAETMDDTVSVGYYVQTSEYVRDQARSTRVYCRFDGSKPRWKKTPRPQSGAAVFIVGLAHGIHLNGGNLLIDVDQVQLNVGSTISTSSATGARQETGGPPAKKRRFPLSTTNGAAAETGSSTSTSQGTTLPAPGAASEDIGENMPPRAPGAKSKRVVKRKAAVVEDETPE